MSKSSSGLSKIISIILIAVAFLFVFYYVGTNYRKDVTKFEYVKVAFYSDEGALIEQTEVLKGGDVTFPKFSRVGYKFLGWARDNLNIVTTDKPTEDVEYYAITSPIVVNVTFRYLDGTSQVIKATYGVGLEEQPTIPASQRYRSDIRASYTGNFKNLTSDLIVEYYYVDWIDLPVVPLS